MFSKLCKKWLAVSFINSIFGKINMGRVKTQLVKRAALRFMKEHPRTFKKDFSENKTLLIGVSEIYSRKLRNVIAGYLTRLVRQRETGK